MADVTEAWRRSDNAKAFVRALEERGYILCAGDKRPYVLVDLYGQMNALPKLIADKAVRTKDVVAFLEKDFPAVSLPTVDEARALAAQHRLAQEDFARTQRDHRKLDQLKAVQADRRAQALADRAALDAGHKIETFTLAEGQRLQRLALKRAYVQELRRVQARPAGLAAFLGRVTGVNLVIRQVQKYRDSRRWEAYRAERAGLVERQRAETMTQTQRHRLQAFDADRALRSLDQVDERERKSLETKQVRAERTKQRGESGQMPALGLELKPRGRGAVPHKAEYRYRKRERAKDEPPRAMPAPERQKPEPEAQPLKEEFARAAGWRGDEGHREGGDTERPRPDQHGQDQHEHEQHDDHDQQGQEAATVAPELPDPHWTELPLGDEFHRAARDRDAAREEEDSQLFKPSRASRRGERGRDQEQDRDDFERER